MKALSILPASITVPAAAKTHPHLTEAKAVAKVLAKKKNVENGGVIGTQNNRRAELYGWHNPVRPHIDQANGDQWIYGLVLAKGGLSSIGLWEDGADSATVISPSVGEVFRLNDSRPHWTEGKGSTVCLFVGEYSEPDDAGAYEILRRGVNRLAAGLWSAPAIGQGFRVPSFGKVWATNNFESRHLVPETVAERRGWEIIRCSSCDSPAIHFDSHWPYDWTYNACAEHRGEGVEL